ncbi:MAG: AbrB family transcriptional regulator [Acidobacteria bacterium]|nr:MAG: AbrB family transcriptional regulator [Acidobacteriota bacterium]
METVKISSKFQVVIPHEARESLRLRPGQRVRVFVYDGRLEFIPILPMKEMRGFARGMDSSFEREKDRY